MQAREDFTSSGEWFWGNRLVVSNSGAAWQNPGGGFGANCPTWGRKTTCRPTQNGSDQLFRLIGELFFIHPTPPGGTQRPAASDAGTAPITVYEKETHCSIWFFQSVPLNLYGSCLRGAISANADIITVTKTNDSGPGSLRQALVDANDGDTINFAVTGTIGLTTAELAINHDVTILGPIAVARTSQAQFRIFHVMPGHNVTIDGLTITGGQPNLGSYGGAVLNDHASLTISNCSLTTNSSTYGGAISSDGSGSNAALTVLNSNIISNFVYFAGGGTTTLGATATVSLLNSSIINNTAAYSGYRICSGRRRRHLQQRWNADDHQQQRKQQPRWCD